MPFVPRRSNLREPKEWKEYHQKSQSDIGNPRCQFSAHYPIHRSNGADVVKRLRDSAPFEGECEWIPVSEFATGCPETDSAEQLIAY